MNNTIRAIQFTLALCLLSLPPLLASSAMAKVRISERTKYYTVSGKTGKQLFKSIGRRGPKLRKTGHAIAVTSSKIKIANLKISIKGRRCVVKADVILKIVYTLPRWRGSKRATPKLRRKWEKFNRLVQKHEATHGRISREFARQFDKKINKISGRVSKGCSDFGRRSKRAIRLIKKKYLSRHKNYDRREGRASSRIRRLQKALLLTK